MMIRLGKWRLRVWSVLPERGNNTRMGDIRTPVHVVVQRAFVSQGAALMSAEGVSRVTGLSVEISRDALALLESRGQAAEARDVSARLGEHYYRLTPPPPYA